MLLQMKQTAGVFVEMTAKGPRVYVAVLKGSRSDASTIELFILTTPESTLVGQLADLATTLANRLDGLRPEALLIRRADYSKQASNKEGPKARLIIEGALAAAAKSILQNIHLCTGKEVAALGGAGFTKDSIDAHVEQFVDGKIKFNQAAAAAYVLL